MQVNSSRIDTSMSSMSMYCLKERPADLCSIWKPLKGPVQDWPLALCDASSIEKEDLVPCDIVSSTEVTENVILHFNSGQRWHYLSNQLPSELLVFRQIDSLGVTKSREWKITNICCSKRLLTSFKRFRTCLSQTLFCETKKRSAGRALKFER